MLNFYFIDERMMSAETHRSASNSSLRSEPPKGTLVRSQPVTESSLLDSVAGFINEVQALNKPHHDSKLQITWASFQRADMNDPALFPEIAEVNGNFPPLLLALGYTQGVQIWHIPMNGEFFLDKLMRKSLCLQKHFSENYVAFQYFRNT